MIWGTFVPGVPAPQGSKVPHRGKGGRLYVRESSKRLKPWRDHVAAQLSNLDVRFEGAVWVQLRFVFERPKSHRPDSLPTGHQLGDVDKLTRAVLDALTMSGLIADDAYVVELRNVRKEFGPYPGVHLAIGSAVENPFGRPMSLAERVTVPREAIEAWQPRTEDLARARLEELAHGTFTLSGHIEDDRPSDH